MTQKDDVELLLADAAILRGSPQERLRTSSRTNSFGRDNAGRVVVTPAERSRSAGGARLIALLRDQFGRASKGDGELSLQSYYDLLKNPAAVTAGLLNLSFDRAGADQA